MKFPLLGAMTVAAAAWLVGSAVSPKQVLAQEQTAAADAAAEANAAEPLSADELEVLVSRIALYPDELVAVIVAASLYPVEIVQAQRYLERVKTKPDLKPDSDWDGSVISLLNYPDVVKMMSDDLDWTETLGDVVANQEKEMLEAIQQLRDRAVAQGVIKSDEKTRVVQENDKVVIQPAVANEVYVPVYEPQMLYEPDYVPAPVTYYPEPYPSYYYPTAPYFAGVVTGAIWAAAVDWDDWGVWGGNGRWGNDVDIDCNNCFNNRDFNGKINFNDVDWKNVDRSKINFDKSQFNKIDRSKVKDGLRNNDRNDLRNKATDRKRNRPSDMAGRGDKRVKDVRKSTLDGLKNKGGNKAGNRAAGTREKVNRPSQGTGAGNKLANRGSGKIDRPISKKKPAGRPDARPKKPSPMGDITRGRDAKSYSNRGGRSNGGGMNRGGGGAPKVKRRPSGGGFGGGGGRRGGGGGGRRR